MTLQQFRKAYLFCQVQTVLVLCLSIATHVVIVYEVGGCSDIDGSLSSILHLNGIIRETDASILTFYTHAGLTLSRQAGLNTFMVGSFDFSKQATSTASGTTDQSTLTGMLTLHCARHRAAKRHSETEGVLLIRLQMDNDNTISLRGKDSALVLYTFIYIRGGGGSVSQIQGTLVFLHILVAQGKLQAAHRQEAHTVRARDEVLVNQLRGLILLALENQTAHLGQHAQ